MFEFFEIDSEQYHTARSNSILRGVNSHFLTHFHWPLKGFFFYYLKGYIFHFCTNVLGLIFFYSAKSVFFLLNFEYFGENETKFEG